MSKFKSFFIKNLELREKEVNIFILLFLHSFFVGWFIAFYFVSANSVFIVHYGSEHLPYAYILAGFMGYLISTLYSYLQKRVNSKTLFLTALLFMLVISLIGPLGLHHIDEKYLSAFVFIWAWPFISLSGIELGGLAIRFLNLGQVKRLYALFNMGGVLAAILSYFAIPFLKPLVGHIYYLLYIGAAGLFLGIIVLFWLYKVAGGEDVKVITKKDKHKKESKITFASLLKEKYFVWIFVSATLSMTMIYLVDFGFLSAVKAQISPDYVAQYLGIVFGALKVGELIISYYSRRLLSQYGVKVGLTSLPVISASLVLIAAIVGFTVGAQTVLFLAIMTLLKALERIIRRGLDDPAFNILYQPLPEDKKLAVQVRVGVVMQLAISIAGALLLLATKLLKTPEGFNLKLYPVFFLPILLVWVYVAFQLYKSYKAKIREILAEISKDKRRGTDRYQYGSEILKKRLKQAEVQVVQFSASVLSETNPKILEPYASSLLKDVQDNKFYKIVLRYVDPTWRKRLAKTIDQISSDKLSPEVKLITEQAKSVLDYTEITDEINEEQAHELLNSERIADRLKLIKYIHKRLYTPSDEVLLKLLDDRSKLVRISAINISHHNKSDAILRRLSEMLEDPGIRHIAGNALLDFGSLILPYLEEYFTKETSIDTLLKTIEILAKIGTKDAQEIILKQIDYPHREVQLAAIWGLFFCKFQANEQQKHIIRKKIEETVDNALWIYATIEDIYDQKGTLKLFLALEYEKELNLEILFLLLSFLYEPRIITLIQKNIVGKENIFALEIIDNFFDQDIKKIISPLFEDVSPAQKIKRLSKIFPQQRMNFDERLRNIILHDYNKIGTWTVAKAIELLGKQYKKKNIKTTALLHDYSDVKVWTEKNVQKVLEHIRKSDIPDEIFAALYHSDELIYSTAAKIIFDENPIKCFDYLSNMSPQKQKLMKILAHNGHLLQDKIKLLKRNHLFFQVTENHLTKLAQKSDVKLYSQGQDFDYSQFPEDVVILIVKGTLAFGATQFFHDNSIIVRGMNLDEFANSLTVEKDSTLLVINRKDFFNILISERELIIGILENTDHLYWVFGAERHHRLQDERG